MRCSPGSVIMTGGHETKGRTCTYWEELKTLKMGRRFADLALLRKLLDCRCGQSDPAVEGRRACQHKLSGCLGQSSYDGQSALQIERGKGGQQKRLELRVCFELIACTRPSTLLHGLTTASCHPIPSKVQGASTTRR